MIASKWNSDSQNNAFMRCDLVSRSYCDLLLDGVRAIKNRRIILFCAGIYVAIFAIVNLRLTDEDGRKYRRFLPLRRR